MLTMRSVDLARLEGSNALLGEVALNPGVWPQAMENISQAVGATGAMLLQSDIRTRDIPHTPSVEESVQYYFRNDWHVRDIRSARGFLRLIGGASVVTDQDILTPDELRSEPFYHEFLSPCRLQWFAAIGFRAGPALWALSIQRTPGEGPFDKQDKRLLATLSQRLTEVATLSTLVGRTALSSATNALNAVRQAVIAIDRFGRVLDTNAVADSIFDDDIHVKNRRLFVADLAARLALEKLADRLRITPDTAPLPSDPIVVRRDGKGAIIARVLPVHGAARSPFLGARALLTLTPLDPRPGPNAALLTKAFALTPAEARLASLIAEGLNLEKAAEELGIARETARNQLKAVFAKTGTHRQGELVAILTRL